MRDREMNYRGRIKSNVDVILDKVGKDTQEAHLAVSKALNGVGILKKMLNEVEVDHSKVNGVLLAIESCLDIVEGTLNCLGEELA